MIQTNGKKVIHLTVNGKKREITLTNGMRRLLDVLREDIGLTGCKEGCGEGECGACAVLLNGNLLNSCLVPIGQIDAAEVLTSEGFSNTELGHILAESFTECHGIQCGFCTPGMMMACAALMRFNSNPDEQEIRQALSGNICRCTGYDMIIDAVLLAAEKGRNNGCLS